MGAYLHGSLTTGDFLPGRSDIDLLFSVANELADGELQALQEVSTAVMSEQTARVDLRVVTQATAACTTRTPVVELYVGYRPGSATDVMRRTVEPDLLVGLSTVRQSGMALVGPEPRSVIVEPRADWIREYGEGVLAAWERLIDDARHAELMVLTACRIWRFAIEQRHCSKTEAGRWALLRDGSLIAVRKAIAQRRSGDTVIDPRAIARLLAVVRAKSVRSRVPA